MAAVVAATPANAQSSASTPAPSAPRLRLPNDSLAIARKFAGWFLTSQADSLWNALPAADRVNLTTEQMNEQMAQFAARAGQELEILEERWVRRNGNRQYWRFGRYSDAPDTVVLRFVVLPDGSLGGIGLSLAGNLPPVDPEP